MCLVCKECISWKECPDSEDGCKCDCPDYEELPNDLLISFDNIDEALEWIHGNED